MKRLALAWMLFTAPALAQQYTPLNVTLLHQAESCEATASAVIGQDQKQIAELTAKAEADKKTIADLTAENAKSKPSAQGPTATLPGQSDAKPN